jgi:hypothetical protein
MKVFFEEMPGHREMYLVIYLDQNRKKEVRLYTSSIKAHSAVAETVMRTYQVPMEQIMSVRVTT